MAKYKVEYADTFDKAMKKLDRRDQRFIIHWIDQHLNNVDFPTSPGNELISQDSLTSKRDFKVGKDVLNLHEKLTAPSNRRLTDQSLTLFNLNWSIDRITIVGFLKKFDFDRTIITEDGEIIYTAGEDFTMFLDKATGREKGRIDFNPNKIQHFLKINLKDFIKLMFEDPHFSRADVACDIINLDDEYVNQYRLVDAVSFRPYYGQSGQLETAYWGARSSERQVRLYNKRVERLKKKEVLPENVKFWWRLHSNHENWNKLSVNSRKKYRKLAKEVAKEDELTQHLKASFSESVEQLDKELNNWLFGMTVNRNEEEEW